MGKVLNLKYPVLQKQYHTSRDSVSSRFYETAASGIFFAGPDFRERED